MLNHQGDVKVLALKCMQKMLQKFPRQFEGYAELVILRVLELHKDDTFRDVSTHLILSPEINWYLTFQRSVFDNLGFDVQLVYQYLVSVVLPSQLFDLCL